jgi:hypothetical protein
MITSAIHCRSGGFVSSTSPGTSNYICCTAQASNRVDGSLAQLQVLHERTTLSERRLDKIFLFFSGGNKDGEKSDLLKVTVLEQ